MPQLDPRDHALLIDIINFGSRAIRHMGSMSFEEFVADEKTFDGVVRCLSVVGEAAWKLSKQAQQAYPAVPWMKIAGMRHRLVHNYSEVDPNISYRSVKDKFHSQRRMLSAPVWLPPGHAVPAC